MDAGDDDKDRILRGAAGGAMIGGAGTLGHGAGLIHGAAIAGHGHEIPQGKALLKWMAKRGVRGAVPGAAFGGAIGLADYLARKKED